MEKITGSSIICGLSACKGTLQFKAEDPAHNTPLEPSFTETTIEESDRAVAEAHRAFEKFQELSFEEKNTRIKKLLESIALGLEREKEEILSRGELETRLPRAALEGELARTAMQARFFAKVVSDGSYAELGIDHADTKSAVPAPDIRTKLCSVGVVVVFGASNFPLAYSVSGGDTVSAFAAGCPVVVKAHPSHPGVSEIVGWIIVAALREAGMPASYFALLQSRTPDFNIALVQHDLVKAVGFTGSYQGGKALEKACFSRKHPILFHGELGSVNPVFLSDGSLTQQAAQALSQSIAMRGGQQCTCPGVIVVNREKAPAFIELVAEELCSKLAVTMLSKRIWENYQQGTLRMEKAGARLVKRGAPVSEPNRSVPQLYAVDAEKFINAPELREEVFGASTLIVVADSYAQWEAIAQSLEGQLTATVWVTKVEESTSFFKQFCTKLSRLAGRIVLNGVPTGLRVCAEVVHGGPAPSSTNPYYTSVGARAIRRWLRPVCWQGFDNSLLCPEELVEGGLVSAPRRIDGVFSEA